MKDSLRILQVSTSDGTGGAEQVAMSLHRAYRSAGVNAWMAVGHRASDEAGVLCMDNVRARGLVRSTVARAGEHAALRIGGKAGSIVRGLTIGATAPRRFLDLVCGHEDFEMPATQQLLSLAPSVPEVLHCHNLHGEYFDLRELAPLSRRLPVFVTLHDMWMLTGHCAYSLGCDRWKVACGACPHLSVYPAVRRDGTAHNLGLKRRIYAASRLRIAAPSRWLMDRARESVLAASAVEWRLIPHGVDLDVFHSSGRDDARRRLQLSPDDRVLLHAANAGPANPFKDHATIQRAAERVTARVGSKHLVVLVVGAEGEPRQQGCVRFVPRIRERSLLADHYRAADVFLHAARDDNFPNTVLEALACGTPVVATAVGGIPEQIEHGSTGLLAPAGDPAGMAECATQLLKDTRRLRAMRVQAARSARERFDLRRVAGDYLRWYEEVLADERSSSGTL